MMLLLLFPLLLIFLTVVALFAALSTPSFLPLVLMVIGYKVWKARHV